MAHSMALVAVVVAVVVVALGWVWRLDRQGRRAHALAMYQAETERDGAEHARLLAQAEDEHRQALERELDPSQRELAARTAADQASAAKYQAELEYLRFMASSGGGLYVMPPPHPRRY